MWKFCTIADCQTDAPQIKKYNIWWLIKPRRLDCQDLTVKPWTKGRWWERHFDENFDIMYNSSRIDPEPLFRMKNGRGIWIWAQNCPGIDPILKIIEIISRHHEYMRKAPRCTWKNFPGAPFWICRNLRLGYSSLILGWRPKAMTRRAPALRVNYSTRVYVTR